MRIRHLILALTDRCDLQCAYCYRSAGPAGKDMPEAVLQKALDLVLASDDPLHVQFTGGEPMLAFDAMVRTAERIRKAAVPATLAVQTGGAGLDPHRARRLDDLGVGIGISLDGPPKTHEPQRGPAAAVLSAMDALESARVPFHVTTVVTEKNADRLDRLALMLGGHAMARGIGLDLLVERGRARNHPRIRPAEDAPLEKGIRALVRTLASINALRRDPIRLRERDLLFSSPDTGAVFCHACRNESLAVAPDGRLAPCAQTLDDSDFSLGTVFQPGPPRRRLTAGRPEGADCGRCPVNGLCPGDCPSRLHYNRGGADRRICQVYRTLYETEMVNP